MPLYNLLEGALPTVMVVNAAYIKQVPGRKTDVKARSGSPTCGGAGRKLGAAPRSYEGRPVER